MRVFVEVDFITLKLLRKWHRSSAERYYFTQAGPGGGSVPIRDQTSEVSKTSEVFSHQIGWAEPAEEEASIHARLLGRELPAGVVARFRELFGKAATEQVQGPARLARALAGAGRVEAAATAYRQALERQPCNWLLLGEVARFVTFALHSPASGVALARQALALNPACSADLWNTLGDGLFALGRLEEARRAFLKALRINPNDVRAHYNLAFVHCQRQEWDLALAAIARGLALDGAGEYRDGLLQKQAEVLGQIANRQQRDLFLMANRTNACPTKFTTEEGKANRTTGMSIAEQGTANGEGQERKPTASAGHLVPTLGVGTHGPAAPRPVGEAWRPAGATSVTQSVPDVRTHAERGHEETQAAWPRCRRTRRVTDIFLARVRRPSAAQAPLLWAVTLQKRPAPAKLPLFQASPPGKARHLPAKPRLLVVPLEQAAPKTFGGQAGRLGQHNETLPSFLACLQRRALVRGFGSRISPLMSSPWEIHDGHVLASPSWCC
jgi:tetratricopeptide (TPR) repeat protein